MAKNISTAEEWLTREDTECRQDRLARLHWLVDKASDAEYWTFPGGPMSIYLFEEARYCFIYGQFLATIVLGLSCLEHTLAGLFYESGRNDLERSSISVLLKEALSCGWINQTEFDNLERAREMRNPVAHFRRPGHDETIEHRAVNENELPYIIIEEDARHVIETVLHLISKNAA